MRRFKIPMEMLDEPLRVEPSIHKTARGQVQKVKYHRMDADLPTTNPPVATVPAPSQQMNNPGEVHDEDDTFTPLHQRTSGKVGQIFV